MSARYLLISDPPHGEVDAARATRYFGLTVAEVRMKSNYGLPEIWFTEEDEAKLSRTAAALKGARLNTVLVAGSDLVEIPGQNPGEWFVFKDEGLGVGRDNSERTMAYDTPTIAVVCRPRVDVQEAKSPVKPLAARLASWGQVGTTRRRNPDEDQAVSGTPPFLDFYAQLDDGICRTSIAQEITSFPTLPADLPHGLSAMRNLVAECENRFEKAYLDRRLVDMTLRGMANVVTSVDFQIHRRGFSYATEALAHLLGSLSPDLKDISQADLSSRLAYLTNRSRI